MGRKRRNRKGRRRPSRNGTPPTQQSKRPAAPKHGGKGRPTPKRPGRSNVETGASLNGVTPSEPPHPLTFVPPGWFDRKPAPMGNQPTPAQCTTFRRRLLDWVADGLDGVHAEDETDLSPRTYAACWKGRVIDVHRRAVDAADAVICLAGDMAMENVCFFDQPTRGAVGLNQDSDQRVLECRCGHDGCTSEDTPFLEMGWPAGNAALECHAPGIGFVTPSQALSRELQRRGLGSTDPNHPAYSLASLSLWRKLGLGPDRRRHKPIDTRRMVRDAFGNLLAVRPQPRPGAKVSLDDAERFLRDRPEGATYKAMTEHFGVSQTTIKRVLDDLNPEFIARGSTDRCIRQRRDNQHLWSIANDEDAIADHIGRFGSPGREYDINFEVAGGRLGEAGLVLGMSAARRW